MTADDRGAFESFERTFRDGVSSCRGECECGRVFYNPDGGWDWEDGELEALAANPESNSLPYAVGYLTFEGRTYIDACECWHERARRIVAFLREHDEKIAAFLSAEQARKVFEAQRSPVVQARPAPQEKP